MKVLSFIIPAYNSEAYIDKCVSSMIVPKLMDKLEIIVVNDGSEDMTKEKAEKFCRLFPESVRLITQENRGHGGAINTGTAFAQGKYLKIIDADDWVETENLAGYINFLENCESDVVLTHHRTIDIGNGEIKKWRSYPEQYGTEFTLGQILDCWKKFDRSMTFHGITYRTEFYHAHRISLPEHVFFEDHEYAAFPCCYASKITCFDIFVYDYRIGDVNQSVSDLNQLKRIDHIEKVLECMAKEWLKVPSEDGKKYAALKIQGLLLAYYTIALLSNSNRRQGRIMAEKMERKINGLIPEACRETRPKYVVFRYMNFLHMSKRSWEKIKDSLIYRIISKNHSFD